MNIWKLLLAAFSFLITLSLHAQDFYRQGQFVLKGQVKNTKTNLVDFGLTSFFDGSTNTLKLKDDGSFNQAFNLQNQQSFFLWADSLLDIHINKRQASILFILFLFI